jgi:hypothetical protein
LTREDPHLQYLKCEQDSTNHFVFVGETIAKPDFVCHCRYAVATYDNPDFMELALRPADANEVFSIGWWSTDTAAKSLRPRRWALLREALRLCEIFHFSRDPVCACS